MRRHLRWVICLFAAGCDDDEQSPVSENCGAPSGDCDVTLCSPAPLEGNHLDPCSVIAWPSNPPTSGQHYTIWADFKEYTVPVPRGFWLHSAEHGGVVLAYNCDRFDGDCATLTDALSAFRTATEPDPLCEAAVVNRILITPDPLLEVAFAAVAWGHSLKASCFDEDAVQSFVDAHYGMNYEDFCTGGIDPSDPDEGFPADCGQ